MCQARLPNLACRLWLPLGLLAAIAPVPALAQRVQFPTMVEEESPFFRQPGAPATLGGTIQPANPNWDAYADPQVQAAPAAPQGGVIRSDGTVAEPYRLVQGIDFQYTWLAGDGGDDFGINDLELSASFAFPFLYNASPAVVTPGFAVHYWSGPDSPDLPPRVYDAYLDVGWRPVINQWLSADLGARVGVYSDFEFFDDDSIRVMARGLAIFGFSATLQIAAGVVFIDRNDIKLLPAGGVIWTPNEDVRFDIVFPTPKAAQRLWTLGNNDLWWYVAGEFGGGAWTILRADGAEDSIDYNDLRISLGLEMIGLRGKRGYLEVGYVWDREIEYFKTNTPTFKPDDTVMLRAGIHY